MNLLLVTYYFPPMGLSGVLRPLKFVKHLSEFGWKVQVLTTSPGSYYAFDESLLDEVPTSVWVVRTSSLDPHHIGGGGGGRSQASLAGATGRSLSRMVFIPDSKIGWYPYAASKGSGKSFQREPDVVLATAPPWTSFLVGKRIAARYGKPLVIDYRDSWLMDAQSPQPTAVHRWIASRLEASVIERCSAAITVNELLREELVSRYPGVKARVFTIYNGYDPDDFSPLLDVPSPFTGTGNELLRLFYMGTLYQDVNKPETLFEALRILKERYGKDELPLEVVFMGMVDKRYPALSRKLGIGNAVRFLPYRPHREALASLLTADAAILFVDPHPHADRHVPGKLFEYLGSGKPVLALAPARSEAARIVEENGAGKVLPPDDPWAIAECLVHWIDLKSSGRKLAGIAESSLAAFQRRNQVGMLDRILRDVMLKSSIL
ncbi:MAG: glycosyltransferase family 4 protein [Candidatus Glassbacteria bacterium]